jgi:hypothetical protein
MICRILRWHSTFTGHVTISFVPSRLRIAPTRVPIYIIAYTGGPRPVDGHPAERLYRAMRFAITAEAKAKRISREEVVEQHFPGAMQSVPERSTPRRNRSKPPSLDC